MATLSFTHDHIGLSAIDIDATVDWYVEKLGFSVETRFSGSGHAFAFLSHGAVRLELKDAPGGKRPATNDLPDSFDPDRLYHFCLRVPDLEEALGVLAERDVPVRFGPFDVPPIGQRIAFIVDREGNWIELTSPLAA